MCYYINISISYILVLRKLKKDQLRKQQGIECTYGRPIKFFEFHLHCLVVVSKRIKRKNFI